MIEITFAEFGVSMLTPLEQLWISAVELVPGLIGALILIIIGFFIAWILGHAVKVLLEKLKLDERAKKAKIIKAAGHIHLPAVFGEITKWYVFIIFLQAAVDLLHLGTLSDLLTLFVLWLPNVIAAVLVILFGLIVAHYVEIVIKEHTKMKGIGLLTSLIKAVIIIIILVVALSQIGIDVSIIENTFLILIGGLSLGIALAIGLGFGLANKGGSKEWFKNLKKNL